MLVDWQHCSVLHGCSTKQDSVAVNEIDSRVAAGVSEDLTQEFADALNRNDKLSWIAANADQYSDTSMLELALNEPASIDFVAAYPSSDKTAELYGDSVTAGSAPLLYDWDTRWGNVDYAGSALGVTGSGPTALSMTRNGFESDDNEFVQADVLRWVDEQRRTKNRWDLIFCDVPTFSNSNRMRDGSWDVQRDHVGKPNIYVSWPFVKVCLILNYLGQGAWILVNNGNAALLGIGDLNPFFQMIPEGMRVFAVVLSTFAAIIASQALITGSYSIVSEAVRLDLMG